MLAIARAYVWLHLSICLSSVHTTACYIQSGMVRLCSKRWCGQVFKRQWVTDTDPRRRLRSSPSQQLIVPRTHVHCTMSLVVLLLPPLHACIRNNLPPTVTFVATVNTGYLYSCNSLLFLPLIMNFFTARAMLCTVYVMVVCLSDCVCVSVRHKSVFY